MFTDDPVRDEMMHTRAMDLRLARRPKCHVCKRHIQDSWAVHFDDIYVCLECVEDKTEYIEEE